MTLGHVYNQIEFQMPNLAAWWLDEALYQNPKPDNHQIYPAPTSILNPNPKLRSLKNSLDPNSWNILKNKERELMQTTNQIDFYNHL